VVAEFLSAEWVAALDAAARTSSHLARCAGETQFVLEQRVSLPNGRVVAHHLLFAPDGARARPGEAAQADIVLLTDLATAIALARGSANAQRVLTSGALRVRGDLDTLLSRADAFRALDDVFAAVRRATTFPPDGIAGTSR
jgi:hypothetical protein